MEESTKVEIAVIGAGLSGLHLADRLVSSGRDNVLVIEANDRIGGRLFNQAISSSEESTSATVAVEGGGQFIGGTHARMLELIDRLGLEKFSAKPPDGKFRWAQEIVGPIRFGLCPDTREPGAFEVLRKEVEDGMASQIPVNEPWNAPNAQELDSRSFADFLRTKPKAARVPYERLCTMHLGCDPESVSLLYMLFLLASTGGYKRFTEYENGAHQWRVKGGAYRIVDELAKRVGSSRIRLNTPVKEIVQNNDDGGCVEIRGDGGFTVNADHVVVTLQPQLCGRIQFKPDVSAGRKALHEQYLTRTPYTAKTHFVYDKPFWRYRGYSGTGVTSSGVVFIDNTPPPDGDDKEQNGILLAFRDRRRRDLTHDKLKAYAKTLFGPEASRPINVVEQDWSTQPNAASCISYCPPNLLSKHGQALREPEGRIHWAGAETSSEWPSFMEGAIEASNRVFGELMT
jgi:monoamine oxidase